MIENVTEEYWKSDALQCKFQFIYSITQSQYLSGSFDGLRVF
jgi:hypothetical protein